MSAHINVCVCGTFDVFSLDIIRSVVNKGIFDCMFQSVFICQDYEYL